MAWTAPATWVDSTVPDEDDLNEQVKDNLTYLKGKADRIGTCDYDGVSLDTGTTYQNTGTKVLIILYSGHTFQIGSSSPPTINVYGGYACIPIGWYYTGVGNARTWEI